jgi:hypothetical protein
MVARALNVDQVESFSGTFREKRATPVAGAGFHPDTPGRRRSLRM